MAKNKNGIRPQILIAGVGLFALVMVLGYVVNLTKNQSSDDMFIEPLPEFHAPPVQPEEVAPKEVASVTAPVESNELRFKISRMTLSEQRPLPPAPMRQQQNSEQSSNQSAVR